MRLSLTARSLSSAEQTLVTSVFGPTLPPWKHILIDAGLGLGDRPYTLDGPPGFYTLHVGPFCYPDCSIKATWGRFGRVDTLFVGGMRASATAFPYIDKVVRRGGGAGASKTLADLATMP